MFTTIRNNPKKTVFFSGLLGYGAYYCNTKFKDYNYRRALCEKAMCGAEEHIGPAQELTRVTVIHNPVANNRKSGTVFKKDIYPLLNLSGYKVTVAETERAEEGKEMMSVLKVHEQECVCVAGGDGTLMEVITGLLRREDLRDRMQEIPLVVMPLGVENCFASRNSLIRTDDLIGTYDENIKLIKKGQVTPHNVIQLRMSSNSEVDEAATDKKPKDIFAVSGLEWSIDRDVVKVARRKWVFGPLRYHWQYFVSALFGEHSKANKSATIVYKEHCTGCSKCTPAVAPTKKSGSRFSLAYLFFPLFFRDTISKDKEKMQEYEEKSAKRNDGCGVVHERHLDDVRGLSVVLDKDELKVRIRRNEPGAVDYIQSGLARLSEEPYGPNNECEEHFSCAEMQIVPGTTAGEHYYVDNEQLDAVPIDIRVIKNAVYFHL